MKTIKYLIFSLLILALFPGCNKDDNGNSPEFKLRVSNNLDDLDYSLYSLVLEQLFTNTNNLVVNQEIRAGGPINNHSFMQSMKEQYSELDTMVFYDPVLAIDSVYYFENKFSVPSKKVSLISAEEIQYIFSNTEINAGWEEFYRRYPNSPGTISFSRIGYNTDKTQAVVDMGNMYASLRGEGFLVFLKLENNKWKIVITMLTWIS
jgi:hypothetical protein